MEHIEDLIFNEGVDGARQAINFLRDLRDTLAGNATQKVNMTVKWDGAPAIFAGIDPSDKKFFVAKKGLFNINPVMYKSVKEVKGDSKLGSELKSKFVVAYNEFSKLGIKDGVYQGDLMFTKGDVKTATIEGQKYFTFQPNTIVYVVPVKSKLGAFISKAKIGVVWHTTYKGKDIKSMKGSFGKDIVKKFKKVNSIWQDDATYKDVSGNATFTKEETEIVTSILSNAGKAFRTIPSDLLKIISEDEELKQKIKTFNNTYVREGKPFPNPSKHVTELFTYLDNWYEKQKEKRKSKEGQAKIMAKKDQLMSKILSRPKDLINIFTLMNHIVEAKQLIINKLNQAGGLGTFLRTSSGFKATNQEGFVAIDNINGSVKLVDRLEFSKANFSPDVIKGWQ
jgi:hypothetical protein